jgi:hypothetical protein
MPPWDFFLRKKSQGGIVFPRFSASKLQNKPKSLFKLKIIKKSSFLRRRETKLEPTLNSSALTSSKICAY